MYFQRFHDQLGDQLSEEKPCEQVVRNTNELLGELRLAYSSEGWVHDLQEVHAAALRSSNSTTFSVAYCASIAVLKETLGDDPANFPPAAECLARMEAHFATDQPLGVWAKTELSQANFVSLEYFIRLVAPHVHSPGWAPFVDLLSKISTAVRRGAASKEPGCEKPWQCDYVKRLDMCVSIIGVVRKTSLDIDAAWPRVLAPRLAHLEDVVERIAHVDSSDQDEVATGLT